MLIERQGRRLPLNTRDGIEAFYANLEDYVRLLQAQGAKIYLILGHPIHHRFDPAKMVTRGVTGFQIAPNVGEAIPLVELQAPWATAFAKLRAVGENTGATLLDPFPDICGMGNGCLPFFAAAEPKYTDFTHLRPVFVREHVRFLDFLLR